jgi:GDP-L-fucose synthase
MKSSKIYIAGHTGMVGSAIHRSLLAQGYDDCYWPFLPVKLISRNQDQVISFLKGKSLNMYISLQPRLEGSWRITIIVQRFCMTNLMIEANIIHGFLFNQGQEIAFSGLVLHISQISATTTEGRKHDLPGLA